MKICCVVQRLRRIAPFKLQVVDRCAQAAIVDIRPRKALPSEVSAIRGIGAMFEELVPVLRRSDAVSFIVLKEFFAEKFFVQSALGLVPEDVPCSCKNDYQSVTRIGRAGNYAGEIGRSPL
jgi:hypothetical protein